jgi:hypothetical protein
MLRSNSFQLIIPTSKRSAMLPSGTSMRNTEKTTWAEGRFMVVVGDTEKNYAPDYHGFKACFDFRNQENIRVWQIPD